MEVLLYTILALTAASVGSVALSGSLLLLNNKWLGKISGYLLYLAGGTLLASALLGLIPEAAETLIAASLEVFGEIADDLVRLRAVQARSALQLLQL